jgi:hypothetical protein
VANMINGVLRCGVCGEGEIGPDITGRPMCYGCGPQEMSPRCPQCRHRLGGHGSRGCAQNCPCMAGSGRHLAEVGREALKETP